MLRDRLTRGERNLVESGFHEDVLHVRHRFQDVMRPDATSMIEELVGRRVIGFMSDNHIDPDLAAEVFVLEPAADGAVPVVAEADDSL
jgi:uncharacterized protein YbcI